MGLNFGCINMYMIQCPSKEPLEKNDCSFDWLVIMICLNDGKFFILYHLKTRLILPNFLIFMFMGGDGDNK
jgi:hypothetical protein